MIRDIKEDLLFRLSFFLLRSCHRLLVRHSKLQQLSSYESNGNLDVRDVQDR
jgi:hypothetical protein